MWRTDFLNNGSEYNNCFVLLNRGRRVLQCKINSRSRATCSVLSWALFDSFVCFQTVWICSNVYANRWDFKQSRSPFSDQLLTTNYRALSSSPAESLHSWLFWLNGTWIRNSYHDLISEITHGKNDDLANLAWWKTAYCCVGNDPLKIVHDSLPCQGLKAVNSVKRSRYSETRDCIPCNVKPF